MLKKYGKAIEQPQETLPLHLHSEQMDGQSTKSERRWAAGSKSPVLCGPLLYLLRAGAFTEPGARFSTWILSPPINGTWAAEKGRAGTGRS